MFIRHQLAPYCQIVEIIVTMPNGFQWIDEVLQPSMHFTVPAPHGRQGFDGPWGPDRFGYTDIDDYELAIYGA